MSWFALGNSNAQLQLLSLLVFEELGWNHIHITTDHQQGTFPTLKLKETRLGNFLGNKETQTQAVRSPTTRRQMVNRVSYRGFQWDVIQDHVG